MLVSSLHRPPSLHFALCTLFSLACPSLQTVSWSRLPPHFLLFSFFPRSSLHTRKSSLDSYYTIPLSLLFTGSLLVSQHLSIYRTGTCPQILPQTNSSLRLQIWSGQAIQPLRSG
ncbi:hypothetical protein BDV59DRAFT_105432 [Aspergillus ambiguus]|uniref:uncharacterized protein n=1 Tax=Aspergillus ambiguus TaxID=176160 RepID=UPI003CCCBC93